MAGVPMNSPMQAMIQMRQAQPQPMGPNQDLSQGQPPQEAIGGRQDLAQGGPPPDQSLPGLMAALAQVSRGPQAGDATKTNPMLVQLKKHYPKLTITKNEDGRAELNGPAQDQFLGATWAKAHGAKDSSVKNTGHGQRLHVAW